MDVIKSGPWKLNPHRLALQQRLTKGSAFLDETVRRYQFLRAKLIYNVMELLMQSFSTVFFQLDGTFSSHEKECMDEVDGQLIDCEVICRSVLWSLKIVRWMSVCWQCGLYGHKPVTCCPQFNSITLCNSSDHRLGLSLLIPNWAPPRFVTALTTGCIFSRSEATTLCK